MEEKKYYCYICGKELTDENKSNEHIILNAIGGQLHSYTLLCKECNSQLGEMFDAKLAEDLSFYTDMLGVKKNRQNSHNQIMKDEYGHDIIVDDGGKTLKLRHPYVEKEVCEDKTHLNITARNLDELKGLLKGLTKDNILTEEQCSEIIKKAKVTKHNPTLKITSTISEFAFPSIIKSAVNFYIERYHDNSSIEHLIPYIKGEKDSKEVLYLHHFKELPYNVNKEQVTHMIHIEGHDGTGLLYAMMEYYGIFIYIVVLNADYHGDSVNCTYAYDVISSAEIRRDFSLLLTMDELEKFRNQPHDEYITYLPYVKQRADNVLRIWEERQDHEELKETINKVLGKYPEGCIITEDIVKELENEFLKYIERKIMRHYHN